MTFEDESKLELFHFDEVLVGDWVKITTLLDMGNNMIYGEVPSLSAFAVFEHEQTNQPPVADAGPDRTVDAWIDGIADVTLDGSGSDDPDGDELTYQWTWTINGDPYGATGVGPTIELPVGEHVIRLVVNDGAEDSEPDDVVVTVIEAMEAELWIFPTLIRRHGGYCEITAIVRMPQGIERNELDLEQPLLLYPGEIEAMSQYAIQWSIQQSTRTSIYAFFDKESLMDAVPDDGRVELQVVGQLKTGRYFYGSDTVRVVSWLTWSPWWEQFLNDGD